jgi:catechol 2,3-dioxygenase-like lactoylglutathione lyase family enzyme
MADGADGFVVSVMLIVPEAAAAVAWYQTALGAARLWDLGGVAGLEINGAPFFVHEMNPGNPRETTPEHAGVTSTRIEVFADDPDSLIERAVAAVQPRGLRSRITAHHGERIVRVASKTRSVTTGRLVTSHPCVRTVPDRAAVTPAIDILISR